MPSIQTRIEYEDEIKYDYEVDIKFVVPLPIDSEDYIAIQSAILVLADTFRKYKPKGGKVEGKSSEKASQASR